MSRRRLGERALPRSQPKRRTNSPSYPRIDVALPTSILRVEHTLFLKSMRVHQVVRWSSIFGVKRVIFYHDHETSRQERREYEKLIGALWKYFLTPPYLRKILVPLNPLLKYVGALPPLRLRVYEVSPQVTDGEKRLGYRDPSSGLIFLGDKKSYKPLNECGEGIVYVRVVDTSSRLAECLDEEVYKGPSLVFENSLRDACARNSNMFIIATDKNGIIPGLREARKVRGEQEILVLFGSPSRDLFELAALEGFKLEDYVDAVWNTVPGQMVVSVRTEEALLSTLAVLNMFIKGFLD